MAVNLDQLLERKILDICSDPNVDMDTIEGAHLLLDEISSIDQLQGFTAAATAAIDKVESEIAAEVHEKAEEFYDTMNSFSQLNDQVLSLVSSANNIHSIISKASMDYYQSVEPFDACVNEKRMLLDVQEILKIAAGFVRNQTEIQKFLDEHAFDDALEMIDHNIHLLHTDLAGILAFESALQELTEMRTALHKMKEAPISEA